MNETKPMYPEIHFVSLYYVTIVLNDIIHSLMKETVDVENQDQYDWREKTLRDVNSEIK